MGLPRLTAGQRIRLATIGKKLYCEALDAVGCIVTRDTILRCHRDWWLRSLMATNSKKLKA
jgi:hypothetical protein